MDTLQELTRRKGIIASNIVTRVQLPDMTEGLPVFHESEFEKAIAEGQIEAFTVENVSQFKRNLEKAIVDANGDAALLGELEKAGRDLSKLVKVKKQDKRGKMTTVYVRQGEKAKEGVAAGKNPDASDSGGEPKIGKISRSHAESNPDDAIHTYSKEIAHHSGMSHDEYSKLHPASKKKLLNTLLTHPAHNTKGDETLPKDAKIESKEGGKSNKPVKGETYEKDGQHYVFSHKVGDKFFYSTKTEDGGIKMHNLNPSELNQVHFDADDYSAEHEIDHGDYEKSYDLASHFGLSSQKVFNALSSGGSVKTERGSKSALDGKHEYKLTAYDKDGNKIASSSISEKEASSPDLGVGRTKSALKKLQKTGEATFGNLSLKQHEEGGYVVKDHFTGKDHRVVNTEQFKNLPLSKHHDSTRKVLEGKLWEKEGGNSQAKFPAHAIHGGYYHQPGEHDEDSSRKLISTYHDDIDNDRSASYNGTSVMDFYNKSGKRIATTRKGKLMIKYDENKANK